jgi:hypothetical protein
MNAEAVYGLEAMYDTTAMPLDQSMPTGTIEDVNVNLRADSQSAKSTAIRPSRYVFAITTSLGNERDFVDSR